MRKKKEKKCLGFSGEDEEKMDGDVALLALMIQHNLNVDVMESVISVLKSGFNFSTLRNAKHWLERLGKEASFNVKTCCERCSHLDVEMVLGKGQSATLSSKVNEKESLGRSGKRGIIYCWFL